ncbi:C-C motif chemokine 3-like [Thomomys bottae]
MKNSVAALAILLCATALCHQAFSAPLGIDTPTACCFSYINHPIQRRFIVDYFETNSQCSQPGIVFLTKKNRQICADPSQAWVQECISDLKLKAEVENRQQEVR